MSEPSRQSNERLVDTDALLRIARQLDSLGMRKSAAGIRAAVEVAPDERVAPVQNGGGTVPLSAIPWGLYERLWRIYDDHGHGSQSAERLAERGGFSRSELGMLAIGDYGTQGMRSGPRGRTIPLLDLYREAMRDA